jgi:hypothetical protein
MADEEEYDDQYEEEYDDQYEEEYEVLPINKEWVDDPAKWFLRLRQDEELLRLSVFEDWIEEELEESPEEFDIDGYLQDLHWVFHEIEKEGRQLNYARFLNALRMVQNLSEDEDIFRGLDEDESDEHSDWLLRSGETPMSGDWEEDDEEEVDEEEEVETTAGDVGAAKRPRDEDVVYVAEKRPREMSLREAVRVLRRHTINTGVKFQELLDKIDKTEG